MIRQVVPPFLLNFALRIVFEFPIFSFTIDLSFLSHINTIKPFLPINVFRFDETESTRLND